MLAHGVFLRRPSAKTAGVGCSSFRKNAPFLFSTRIGTPPDLRDIESLSDALITIVKTRVDAEKAKVLEIVRGKPVAEVLAVGVRPRGTAGTASVNKRRRRT